MIITTQHFDSFVGARRIVRFNWPQYVAGFLVIAFTVGLTILPMPLVLRAMLLIGSGIAGFWIVAATVVSWFVYDHSGVCDWNGITEHLPASPQNWINLHAGIDNGGTKALHERLPGSTGRAFDFFNESEMTERSIVRARNSEMAHDQPVDFRHLPLADESVDGAFLLFAAHELRTTESREAFFAELHRVLRPGGTITIVEHARDPANFIAFGPGFLHFFTPRLWRNLAIATEFTVEKDFRRTPFVRVFILRRLP